jgi:hypothetical protein
MKLMEKKDETTELLREIRDLEKEEVSMLRAEKMMDAKGQRSMTTRFVLRVIYNVVIVAFVIGAFWYFYHTLYGSDLIK